ncbi:MAG: hypothetical protein Q9163_000622 [Psora crenata]
MDSSWNPALRPNSVSVLDDHTEQPPPSKVGFDTAVEDGKPTSEKRGVYRDRNSSREESSLAGETIKGYVEPEPLQGAGGDVVASLDHDLVDRVNGIHSEHHLSEGGATGANRLFSAADYGTRENDTTESIRIAEQMDEAGRPLGGSLQQSFPSESVLTNSGNATESISGKDEVEESRGTEGHIVDKLPLEPSNQVHPFPEVPPLAQSTDLLPQPQPGSQAESIIMEEAQAYLEQAPMNMISSTSNGGGEWNKSFVENTEGEDLDFFADMSGVPSISQCPSQENEQARYEEGLPLVSPTAEEKRIPFESGMADANQTKHRHDGTDNGFQDDVKSIYGSSALKPQSLDHKTTNQVLDSLHYDPPHFTHTASEVQDEIPSQDELGGGMPMVFGDTVKERIPEGKEDEITEPKAEDEDLAEMWKAVLADEDLLEQEDSSVDPSSFFDDGEGFLEDDGDHNSPIDKPAEADPSLPLNSVYAPDRNIQDLGKLGTRSPNSPGVYVPSSNWTTQQRGAVSYYPRHPAQAESSPMLPTPGSAAYGVVDTVRQRVPSPNISDVSRPPMQGASQSFADKSKEGYTSPYDLPADVNRPRKRAPLPVARHHPQPRASGIQHPPPRSTSMYSGAIPSQGPHPPVPSLSTVATDVSAGVVPFSAPKAKPSTGNFFEELPLSKTRSSSSLGRVIQPLSQPTLPASLPAQRGPPKQSPYGQHRNQSAPTEPQAYQLLPAEKMSLYGDLPADQPVRQSVPVMNSRYSPATHQTSIVPPSVNRYASSPMGLPRPPSTQVLAHQPRTSSPLTQNTMTMPQLPNGLVHSDNVESKNRKLDSSSPSQSISPRFPSSDTYQAQSSTEPYVDRVIENSQSQYTPQITGSSPSSFPHNAAPPKSTHDIRTAGPDHSTPSGRFDPQDKQAYRTNDFAQGPPQRSQTQSPSAQKPSRPAAVPSATYQRPASVNNYAPSPSLRGLIPASTMAEPPFGDQAQFKNYIRPTDGREVDSLERWKGCPIISFGFGGTVVKTFPKHALRYTAGQKTPMIMCSPGEIKVDNGRTLALDGSVATFPGPIKAKGKKKEVLEWMQKKIDELGCSQTLVKGNDQVPPDPVKCHEERLLLWSIMKILVEYDGVIEGNSAAESAVRAVLSPEIGRGDSISVPHSSSNAPLLGIAQQTGSTSTLSPVRVEAVEELRKALLHGDRQQAVWHAVDNRLWAHAMLLSSTLDNTIWRQVALEFVRQEVKTIGENTESLSALYQIFAGNWGESIDELVSPSARAGLQMVSKSAASGPTKNALDGLDRWRETLTLILSNRTADDGKALVALGQLLAGYGRTEAAHICYIFAKNPGLFGGPNDPQVTVALLGADHLRRPFDYGRDFESILLTEIYEFARTILTSSSVSTVSPHLQSYKLHHAMLLAEYGYKSEAQQYCENIYSTLKSTTKPSPYYHSLLVGALEDLQDRLRQAPRDSSGSWISKPSIDKVSGSIWAKFNSYVAGDEDDGASTGSGKAHDLAAGPFARVTGDSPTLSRTPSSNELYNTYSSGVGLARTTPTINSRYTPAGLYTPRSSVDQPRRPSQDHLKPSANDTLRPSLAAQQYSSRPSSSTGASHEPYVSPSQSSFYPPRSESYLPTAPSQAEVMAQVPPKESQSSLHQQEAYDPAPPSEQTPPQLQGQSITEPRPDITLHQPSLYHEPTASSYELRASSYEPPSSFEPPISSYEPPTSSYEPPTSSYEPPSDSGYEPPSYNPPSHHTDDPEVSTSTTDEKPKKSIMDLENDDDFEARAAALRREEKARKDREADEAFRKAAETDAQKTTGSKGNNKKSWFGPWFSGTKAKSEASNPNAPIKVKLGEENSFYYDQQLKKWVNKKGGNTEVAAAHTAPPPKVPPLRSVSAAARPPSNATPTPPVPPLPVSLGAGMPPTRTMSGPLPLPHLDSNEPSRTASPALQQPSGAEQASSPNLAATGLPSGPPSGPPSRPATGQSGASNIDDLIGVPQARKGGTVRKAKKGRGYVDVMAK